MQGHENTHSLSLSHLHTRAHTHTHMITIEAACKQNDFTAACQSAHSSFSLYKCISLALSLFTSVSSGSVFIALPSFHLHLLHSTTQEHTYSRTLVHTHNYVVLTQLPTHTQTTSFTHARAHTHTHRLIHTPLRYTNTHIHAITLTHTRLCTHTTHTQLYTHMSTQIGRASCRERV